MTKVKDQNFAEVRQNSFIALVPAVVLDVVGRLDEGHDRAFVRVLGLAVDDRQLVAIMKLLLLRACRSTKFNLKKLWRSWSIL